jgi:hypothetical protein
MPITKIESKETGVDVRKAPAPPHESKRAPGSRGEGDNDPSYRKDDCGSLLAHRLVLPRLIALLLVHRLQEGLEFGAARWRACFDLADCRVIDHFVVPYNLGSC